MARTREKIQEEIRALAPAEQERLLRTLLEDLEGLTDPDVERAWLAEVQRRSRVLDEGKVKPIPADEVFSRARDEIKRP